MRTWTEGEIRDVPGKPYKMKFIGGVYSCTCMAWKAQSKKIDLRSCKHLRAENGDAFEAARIGAAPPPLSVSMSTKPVALPVGVSAPMCDCCQGGTCDVSHDPAACPCEQCAGPKAAEGALPAGETAEDRENAVPLKSGAVERDKSKRVNRFGGFIPFTDQEKAVVCAEEEAKLGRKLRQDEKTDLFGPPILLANAMEDDFDPAGWLESEKLDGVRAYWNGEAFVSGQGNVYDAPDFFRAELPQEPLDGELWMGRKMFQKTISVVKSRGAGQRWEKISFVVFDAPNFPGEFRQRLARIFSLDLGHFAFGHPHSLCKSRKEADEHLKAAAAAGAEGLMYRKPGSLYEGRRSSTLLKFKPFQDAEARLISFVPGRGKHKGVIGGMVLEMPDGKQFNVGTGLTDHDRRNPPPIGAHITYRFTELTNDGIPKCASFVCWRNYE